VCLQTLLFQGIDLPLDCLFSTDEGRVISVFGSEKSINQSINKQVSNIVNKQIKE
jgi:hypothetical protein